MMRWRLSKDCINNAPSKEPLMNPFFSFFFFTFFSVFFTDFFFFKTHRAWKNRLPSSTLHMAMMNVFLTSGPNDLVKKVFIWCVIIASMSG